MYRINTTEKTSYRLPCAAKYDTFAHGVVRAGMAGRFGGYYNTEQKRIVVEILQAINYFTLVY